MDLTSTTTEYTQTSSDASEQPSLLRRIFYSRDEAPRADYPVEIALVTGLPQAYLIQRALASHGMYEGEIDNEIVSPGVFRPRIEPEMRDALVQYVEYRRAEGVDLGAPDLTQEIVMDILDNSPMDITTPRPLYSATPREEEKLYSALGL